MNVCERCGKPGEPTMWPNGISENDQQEHFLCQDCWEHEIDVSFHQFFFQRGIKPRKDTSHER